MATILPFEPIVRFPPTIKIIKPPTPLSELFALPEVVSLLPAGFPTPPEVAALWSVAAFPPGPAQAFAAPAASLFPFEPPPPDPPPPPPPQEGRTKIN